MSEYPTLDLLNTLLESPGWQANKGQVIDPRSLDEKTYRLFTLANQELLIKEQRKTNKLLEQVLAGQKKPAKK